MAKEHVRESYDDVAVLGHDDLWHLAGHYSEMPLCGMGRKGPNTEYSHLHASTCLECLVKQADGHLALSVAHVLWNV